MRYPQCGYYGTLSARKAPKDLDVFTVFHLMFRLLASFLALAAAAAAREQPVDAALLPLADLKPGQRGEVWTVFSGTQPEPFTVEVKSATVMVN